MSSPCRRVMVVLSLLLLLLASYAVIPVASSGGGGGLPRVVDNRMPIYYVGCDHRMVEAFKDARVVDVGEAFKQALSGGEHVLIVDLRHVQASSMVKGLVRVELRENLNPVILIGSPMEVLGVLEDSVNVLAVPVTELRGGSPIVVGYVPVRIGEMVGGKVIARMSPEPSLVQEVYESVEVSRASMPRSTSIEVATPSSRRVLALSPRRL